MPDAELLDLIQKIRTFPTRQGGTVSGDKIAIRISYQVPARAGQAAYFVQGARRWKTPAEIEKLKKRGVKVVVDPEYTREGHKKVGHTTAEHAQRVMTVHEDELREPEDPERPHSHKMAEPKHKVGEKHANDLARAEHEDEIINYGKKFHGGEEAWVDKLGVKVHPVKADRLDTEVIEYSVKNREPIRITDSPDGIYTFSQSTGAKKHNRLPDALSYVRSVIESQLQKSEIISKIDFFFAKQEIDILCSDDSEVELTSFKSGDNTVTLSRCNGTFSVSADDSLVFESDSATDAIKRFYRLISKIIQSQSEDKSIALEMLGEKIISQNRRIIPMLAGLGKNDESKMLFDFDYGLLTLEVSDDCFTKDFGGAWGGGDSTKHIPYVPPLPEEYGQGMAETGVKPGRKDLEEKDYKEKRNLPNIQQQPIKDDSPACIAPAVIAKDLKNTGLQPFNPEEDLQQFKVEAQDRDRGNLTSEGVPKQRECQRLIEQKSWLTSEVFPDILKVLPHLVPKKVVIHRKGRVFFGIRWVRPFEWDTEEKIGSELNRLTGEMKQHHVDVKNFRNKLAVNGFQAKTWADIYERQGKRELAAKYNKIYQGYLAREGQANRYLLGLQNNVNKVEQHREGVHQLRMKEPEKLPKWKELNNRALRFMERGEFKAAQRYLETIGVPGDVVQAAVEMAKTAHQPSVGLQSAEDILHDWYREAKKGKKPQIQEIKPQAVVEQRAAEPKRKIKDLSDEEFRRMHEQVENAIRQGVPPRELILQVAGRFNVDEATVEKLHDEVWNKRKGIRGSEDLNAQEEIDIRDYAVGKIEDGIEGGRIRHRMQEKYKIEEEAADKIFEMGREFQELHAEEDEGEEEEIHATAEELAAMKPENEPKLKRAADGRTRSDGTHKVVRDLVSDAMENGNDTTQKIWDYINKERPDVVRTTEKQSLKAFIAFSAKIKAGEIERRKKEEEEWAKIPHSTIADKLKKAKVNERVIDDYIKAIEVKPQVKKIAEAPIKNIRPLGGGCNKSLKADYDGEKGAYKPKDGEDPRLRINIPGGTFFLREVAAYRLDQILGYNLVPPTVFKIDEENKHGIGSFQHWENGAGHSADRIKDERVMLRGEIFDNIVYNTDRHGKNFLVEENGDLHLIDNGLILPEREGCYTANIKHGNGILWRKAKGNRELVKEELQNLKNKRKELVDVARIYVGDTAANFFDKQISRVLREEWM